MSIRRITISVPEGTAAKIKRAAGEGGVSAWVVGLVEERLDEAEFLRRWEEFYRSLKPSRRDERSADAMFQRLSRPRRKRRVA